jgi:hypothetical protein
LGAIKVVVRGGFEPPKALPADLQSAPFGHSGTSPHYFYNPKQSAHAMNRTALLAAFQPAFHLLWSWRWDSNPQPADYKSAALPIELRQPKVESVLHHTHSGKPKKFFERTVELMMNATLLMLHKYFYSATRICRLYRSFWASCGQWPSDLLI